MRVLRQLSLVIWVFVVVLVRRLLHGPRVQGWSFRHEVLVSTLRREVRRQSRMAPARVRSQMLEAPVPRSVQSFITRTTGEVAGVPVETLTPAGWEQGGATILYLHGGGYGVCSPGTHRDLTTRLAAASGLRVVVADYRLAPEHPYPAAVEDTLAVWRVVSTEAEQVVVAGDSAGGGLCLALMLRLRGAGDPLPRAAALLSPWVDLTFSGASVDTADNDYLDRFALERFAEHYLQGAEPTQLEVSPVLGDLSGLPPLMVLTGDQEVFFDEDQRLAEAATAAGVDVTLRVGEGMVHAWPAFAAVVPEGRKALLEVAAFLEEHAQG